MLKHLSVFLIFLVSKALFAQAPRVSYGPSGEIYKCVQHSDQSGCYGSLEDTDKNFISFSAAKSNIKLSIRNSRYKRKKAKRARNIGLAQEYYSNIQVLKNVRRGLRSCKSYSDFECTSDIRKNNTKVQDTCEVFGSSMLSSEVSFRIVNGAVCSLASSPIVPVEKKGKQHCTGNFISDKVVLTAAHCVTSSKCRHLSVTTGQGLRRNVKKCISNTMYNGFENNDIALLFLDESAETDIMPLYLENDFRVGEEVAFAGYGISEDDVYDFRATRNFLSEVRTSALSIQYNDGEASIGNTCNGDSGGPLAIKRDDKWFLIGVVSNGDARYCALPGYENSDTSRWTNLSDPSNISFLKDNTVGIIDE